MELCSKRNKKMLQNERKVFVIAKKYEKTLFHTLNAIKKDKDPRVGDILVKVEKSMWID